MVLACTVGSSCLGSGARIAESTSVSDDEFGGRNESTGRLVLSVAVARIVRFLGESPFDITFGSVRSWRRGIIAQLATIVKVRDDPPRGHVDRWIRGCCGSNLTRVLS
jgi:hypothetical protein